MKERTLMSLLCVKDLPVEDCKKQTVDTCKAKKLYAEIAAAVRACIPADVVPSKNNDGYLTDFQCGYITALKEVRANLAKYLGAKK